MRIRLRPTLSLRSLFTFAGLSLIGYAVAMYVSGIWIEARDRDAFAAELARGMAVVAIPDPRQRKAGSPPPVPSGPVDALLSPHSRKPIGLGMLEIDRIGLSVIIRPSSSAADLRKGAGWIPGTSLPGHSGNVALAGHRDTFFLPLRGIRVGDVVRLRTATGPRLYRVHETLVVEPGDTSVLNPTPEATLTLVTCFPFEYVGRAPKRFIVRASSANTF
jgi:sortase A